MVKDKLLKIFENDIPSEVLSNKDKEIVINYFTSEDIDYLKKNPNVITVLKEINKKRIDYEKKNLNSDLNNKNLINEINTLVSFVSYAALSKPDNLELTPIEKTLILFPNIKSLILLTTEELNLETITLKKTIEINNAIFVKDIIIINTNSFSSIYNKLKTLIENEIIIPENTLFDLTLGMKMTSLAFYKVSTEDNIRTVNWQELQVKKTDGRLERIPGTNHFYFVDNPKLENIKLFKNIDKAIENFDFRAASYLYDQINNNDQAFIYEELSKVFTFTRLSDYDGFIMRIDELFKNISVYGKISKRIMCRFNKVLLFLDNFRSDNVEKYVEDFKTFCESSGWLNYNITEGVNTNWKKDMNMKYFNEYESEMLFYYLETLYYAKKSNNNIEAFQLYLEQIYSLNENSSVIFDIYDVKIPLAKQFIKEFKGDFYDVNSLVIKVKDYLIQFASDSGKDIDFETIEYFIENIQLFDELKELVIGSIKLANNKLFIEKNNITIDFDIEKKLADKIISIKSKNSKILKNVLMSESLSTTNFMLIAGFDDEIDYESVSDKDLKDNYRTQWSRFIDYVDETNVLMKDYFKRNNYIDLLKTNFFIIEKIKKSGELSNFRSHRLYVCPDFINAKL